MEGHRRASAHDAWSTMTLITWAEAVFFSACSQMATIGTISAYSSQPCKKGWKSSDSGNSATVACCNFYHSNPPHPLGPTMTNTPWAISTANIYSFVSHIWTDRYSYDRSLRGTFLAQWIFQRSRSRGWTARAASLGVRHAPPVCLYMI
jgi:hypothetical protein